MSGDPRSFADLIARAGADPRAAAALDAAFGRDAVVLVVRASDVAHAVAHRGLPGVASAAWALTGWLAGAVPEAGGRVAVASPGSVVATFDDPLAAVTTALDARGHGREGRLRVAVAVGAGRLVVAPDGAVFGPAVERCGRMTFVAPDDVTVAAGVVEPGALPPGVGVFRAPQHDEQAVGGAFHVLSDHR